jgi:tetratricopeptide (TPR) repeat protein
VFAVLTLASAVLSASLQATPPALPRLALDSYPAPARATLSRIYEEAAAHPDSVRAVGALARMLHAWELWDPAHQAYERAQSLDPQGFEWRYLDAIVLQRLARHAEAAVQLRLAVAQQPTNLPARVKLAEALLDAGAVDESKALFTALVREPAAEPVAELNLGRIAAGDRRHDVAIVHLERAVKLFPEFGAAHYALARSYSALGRSDDARRALALHAQYGPRWPALPDAILATVTDLREDAAAILQRGVKLADAGDVAGAIAAHEAALARNPDLTQAHANLIALYGRNRDWPKAEEHYRAVVRSGVSLADAHYDYGVLLALQEKWESAAAAYREALAVNPLHVNAHNNLGQALERLRQLPEAADAYRAALAVQPGFRLARFNLGRMLIALGRPDEAAGELEKIVEPRDAEAPRYLFALGVAYVRAGRKDEGIKRSIEARKLALEYGQTDLAAAIDRELAALK